MLTTEYEVPNVSMDDLKTRVKSWLSVEGHEYVLQIVSDRHIILTKAKHDVKIFCCYPFLVSMIGIFVIISISLSLPFAQAVSLMFLGSIALVGFVMAVSAWQFFLNPKKVVFEVRFSEGIPITVSIHASGNYLSKSRYDYDTLNSAILRTSVDHGVSLL